MDATHSPPVKTATDTSQSPINHSTTGATRIACAAVFVLLALDAAVDGPLTRLDVAICTALRLWVGQPPLSLAIATSMLASWQTMWCVGMLVALLLLLRGRRLEFQAWAASLMAVGIVNEGTRFFLHRARPPLPYVTEPGASFPSGHSADILLVIGLLYTFWASPAVTREAGADAKSAGERMLVMAAGICSIVAVGLSRILLDIHWMNDVLGGYALGGFILLSARRWLQQRRAVDVVR